MKNNRLIYYWVVPAIIFVYAIFGNPNTPKFVWWALLSSVACALPLMATQYSPLSVVSIIAVLHVLFFPIAVVINLMASSSGVFEDELWRQTPAAMIACSVGMVGLAMGAFIASPPVSRRLRNIRSFSLGEQEITAISSYKIFTLCMLIIPFVIFKLAIGTYYTGIAAGDVGFSDSNAMKYAWVYYIEYIVYASMFLQIRRYLINRSRQDLFLAIVSTLVPILVMLPSGSRASTFGGAIPALLLAIIGFQMRITWRQILFFSSVVILVFALMSIIELYKFAASAYGNPDMKERITLMTTAYGERPDTNEDILDFNLKLLGRRLADYVAVGRIIDMFPNTFQYRYFEDIGYWSAYLLPSPIRPETSNFDPRDSAMLSFKVGFKGGTLGGSSEGSTPAMILGDLYSRFSWSGVLAGMGLIGFLLRILDRWLAKFGVFETLLFGLLVYPLARMPQDSLFGYFLFLTRSLIVVLCIAVILKIWLTRHFGWTFREKTVLNSCSPQAKET